MTMRCRAVINEADDAPYAQTKRRNVLPLVSPTHPRRLEHYILISNCSSWNGRSFVSCDFLLAPISVVVLD